jgi:hypothetical protein
VKVGGFDSAVPVATSRPRAHWVEWLLATAFILVAVARIASTYSVFSATFDEGWHLAVGMEWLDRGQYTYENYNPPLARIAIAVGPYIDGIRSTGSPNVIREGRLLLYQHDRFQRTLTLARIGVLPFFVVASLFLWLWARMLGGPAVGLSALAVFTTLPPVLGHAGLATTDMPMLGAMAALLYVVTIWLERPTVWGSVALGVAGAAALLTKFSSVPFFVVALVLALGGRWYFARDDSRRWWRTVVPGLGCPLVIALGVAGVLVWATYRFHIGTIRGIPVPAPEFIDGIRQLRLHNEMGHQTYLLGKSGWDGFWNFFLVALLVKTPIATLLLGVGGLGALSHTGWRTRQWRLMLPVTLALGVLGVAMMSRINLGVRHLLPLYLGLSIGAGIALVSSWRLTARRAVARIALVLAVSILSISSFRVHPDYIAYFNEIVGNEPDRWLVDSDLDWGQDLLRLADTVKARQIPSIAINYFGTSDVRRHGMPNVTTWAADDRPSGWVAISVTLLRRGSATLHDRKWTIYPHTYDWLLAYEPVARVGRSILLYQLPSAVPPD